MIEFANDKSRLIDAVIFQIKMDIDNGDVTALEELLVFLDNDKLEAYLSDV